MVNKSLTPTDLAKLKKLLVSPVTMLDEPENSKKKSLSHRSSFFYTFRIKKLIWLDILYI